MFSLQLQQERRDAELRAKREEEEQRKRREEKRRQQEEQKRREEEELFRRKQVSWRKEGSISLFPVCCLELQILRLFQILYTKCLFFVTRNVKPFLSQAWLINTLKYCRYRYIVGLICLFIYCVKNGCSVALNAAQRVINQHFKVLREKKEEKKKRKGGKRKEKGGKGEKERKKNEKKKCWPPVVSLCSVVSSRNWSWSCCSRPPSSRVLGQAAQAGAGLPPLGYPSQESPRLWLCWRCSRRQRGSWSSSSNREPSSRETAWVLQLKLNVSQT